VLTMQIAKVNKRMGSGKNDILDMTLN